MGKRTDYGDMTGLRFGRWTVLRMARKVSTDGQPRTACLCRCDCGTERVVYAQSLRGGVSTSCGCAKPKPGAGRRPGKDNAPAAACAPVGDDWMFGKDGARGLFVTGR